MLDEVVTLLLRQRTMLPDTRLQDVIILIETKNYWKRISDYGYEHTIPLYEQNRQGTIYIGTLQLLRGRLWRGWASRLNMQSVRLSGVHRKRKCYQIYRSHSILNVGPNHPVSVGLIRPPTYNHSDGLKDDTSDIFMWPRSTRSLAAESSEYFVMSCTRNEVQNNMQKNSLRIEKASNLYVCYRGDFDWSRDFKHKLNKFCLFDRSCFYSILIKLNK